MDARLIEQAVGAKRVEIDNATQPTGDRRRLPEADQANMEQFLLNLQVILPVIGLDLLKPQPKAAAQTEIPVQTRTAQDIHFEINHKSGAQAEAVEEEGEFVVLEGSTALKDSGFTSNSYSFLKSTLIVSGVLIECGDYLYKFAAPFAFNSPSAAAAIVLDRNANGRTEWKLKGSKRTYADWKLAQPGDEQA